MKNITERNIHLRRFFLISLTIFSLVFLAHSYFLYKDVDIVVAGLSLSNAISWFAMVISASMVIMSLHYCETMKMKKD